jgi:hypothetical protein
MNYSLDENFLTTRNNINKEFKNIYIIDDVMTTAESVVKFKKTLESNGIIINGIIPMITIGKQIPNEKAFESAVNVFNTENQYKPEQQNLIKNRLKTVFQEYTSYKMYKFIRDIATKRIKPEKAFNLLYTAYLQEKAFLMKNQKVNSSKSIQL